MQRTNEEMVELINKAIIAHEGSLMELEAAIGMLMTGRQLGWRPLLLMHDKKTIRKYETILGIDIRVECPAEGQYANKSIAYAAVNKIKSFWKAVRGERPGERSTEMVVLD